jgi:hypothetical protein
MPILETMAVRSAIVETRNLNDATFVGRKGSTCLKPSSQMSRPSG